VPFRSVRFLLVVFDDIRWLLYALRRLILPVPVFLNRFIAARLLFIFGIIPSLFLVRFFG